MNENDLHALQQLATATNGGQWVLVSALVVFFIVRLLKMKPALAAKVPPRARTPLAFLLGVSTGIANKVIEGTPWKVALVLGGVSGVFAVFLHEFTIESLLNGKEIGLKKPQPPDGSTGDPPPPADPPIPPMPPTGTGGLVARLALAAVFAIMVATGVGCSLFTPKGARNALDAIQLACVFQSELSDEKALADACAIAEDLIPLLRKLVAQREAAKRSGMTWDRGADGGADAGGEAGR